MRKITVFLLLFAAAWPAYVSAQWQAQNLPVTTSGIAIPIARGTHAMWLQTQDYVPDTTQVSPVEFVTTSDGGQTYRKGELLDDNDQYFYHIEPFDANTAYFIAAHIAQPIFLLRKTTDGGITWHDSPFQVPTFPDAIHFFDANNGVLIGDPDQDGAFVGISNDGGNSFQRIPAAASIQLVPTEIILIGNAQYVGDNVLLATLDYETGMWRLWRSSDRGHTWQAGEWFATEGIFAARFAFADAQNGMLLRGISDIEMTPLYTHDGGATWQDANALPGKTAYPIANVPGTQNFMAFFEDESDGLLYSALTNDFGKTWNSRKDLEPYVLDDIYGVYDVLPFVFSNLTIVDNHTAWAKFTRNQLQRYKSTEPIVPELPDLELTLSAENDQPALYGSTKYTLTLRNRGITTATGVQAHWLPPYKRTPDANGPFAFQAAYSALGQYDWWSGNWTIAELQPGQSATATVHLYVLQAADVTQTAQITACDQTDIDSQPNNMAGTADEDDEVSYTSHASLRPEAPAEERAAMLEPALSISPNPAAGVAKVQYNLRNNNDLSLLLTDVSGRLVWAERLEDAQKGLMEIPLANLPNGVYFLRAAPAGEAAIVQRLVVAK